MMNNVLAILGDIHLSDYPPARRVAGYREHILEKIQMVVSYVNTTEHIKALCLLGDIFHSKKASNTSFFLVNRLLDILGSCIVPIFIVPGNHDVHGNNMTVFDRSPLKTLESLPNVYFPLERMEIDSGWGVQCLPSDRSRTAEDVKIFLRKLPDNTFPLLHITLAQPGLPLFDSMIYPEAIAGIVPFLAYGDIHEPIDPYTIEGTTFINPGSVSRVSIRDMRGIFNLALFDFKTQEISNVEFFMPVPPEEAFNKVLQNIPSLKAEDLENIRETITLLTPETLEILLHEKLDTELYEIARQYFLE